MLVNKEMTGVAENDIKLAEIGCKVADWGVENGMTPENSKVCKKCKVSKVPTYVNLPICHNF